MTIRSKLNPAVHCASGLPYRCEKKITLLRIVLPQEIFCVALHTLFKTINHAMAGFWEILFLLPARLLKNIILRVTEDTFE
jgi:hypothetical protein